MSVDPGGIGNAYSDEILHAARLSPITLTSKRIRYADNETNYCAKCQTGGRVLADRALSRLLGPTGHVPWMNLRR